MNGDAAAYEGWFSEASLNVRLGFTRAAHQTAAEEWGRTRTMGEELRTYVHELTHFIQAATTPYGLFLHYCREVQTADTIEMVRAMLDAAIPIRRPLLDAARLDLDGPVGATVRGGLARWVSIEMLAAYLAQDQGALHHYMEKLTAMSARLPLLPLLTTFRRLQGGIAHFIATENAGRAARGMPPWDNGLFDVDAINAEGDAPDGDEASGFERNTVFVEAFGNPWGTESILESAATAAEWADSGADLITLRAYAADTTDAELAMYKHCLGRGLEAIGADDVPQFAFTFIALCELALHAPLLPQHAGLRQGRIDPRELFPPLRFELLLGATQNVKPLQGLAEVPRYYLELCKALGWVHPVQMSKVALDGPQIVADRRAQRYIWAQTERAGMQHAFTNLLRRTLDQDGAGEQFRWRYAFPVIEYTDKTLFMGDKETLWWLTTQHVLTKTMRQIILGKTLTVRCPYRGPPQEAEVLTTDLQNTLQTLFGRPFPMARVVMTS